MITIVDADIGNLGSIRNMLKKIGVKAEMATDPDTIARAEKLILPGVGAFDTGMRKLCEKGFTEVLTSKVKEENTPVLGICLGMQLMTEYGEEGEIEGLGWIKGKTRQFRFENKDKLLKIPHMGWNIVKPVKESSLFELNSSEKRFYFVHSYYVELDNTSDRLTKTHYGIDFTSSFLKDNIVGVQYHPEKSHKFGMQLLKNFVTRF